MSIMSSDSDTSIGLEESEQHRLVDKLLEYGDSFLDEEEYDKMKKKRKRKQKVSHLKSNVSEDYTDKITDVGSKKKKKKSKSKDRTSQDSELGLLTKNKVCSKSNKLESWTKDLELDKIPGNEKNGPVDNTGEIRNDHKKQKRKTPEVIVFEDPKKRKKVAEAAKTDDNDIEENSASDGSRAQMSLKKARREVRDFGISGFAYEDKKQLEVRRAIKLGAKPPKKEYVNYKKYMEMQKQKKEDEKNQRELDRKLGFKVSKKRSDKRDVLEGKLKRFGFWSDPTLERSIHGQIGKYRDGVQILRKTDIDTIKKTKIKKM
ncbi:uncharacterized protein LOC144433805 [Glandiceps talaboti]